MTEAISSLWFPDWDSSSQCMVLMSLPSFWEIELGRQPGRMRIVWILFLGYRLTIAVEPYILLVTVHIEGQMGVESLLWDCFHGLCQDVLAAAITILSLGRVVKHHGIQGEWPFGFPVHQALCCQRVMLLSQGAVGVGLVLFLEDEVYHPGND
jgi:hypothetical protein